VGGGRTAANCLQRFSRRGAGTVLKKGRWDKEEDQALLQVCRCRHEFTGVRRSDARARLS